MEELKWTSLNYETQQEAVAFSHMHTSDNFSHAKFLQGRTNLFINYQYLKWDNQ